MSSVVKDSDVLASIPDAKNSFSPASATASGEASSRPQPVALEVAVTVNGARTVAGSDKREPFSESTKTVLIFGNGAVVRLISTVAPGQLLFLSNEKTKKEVVCQVVKSKNYHNVSGYVELEFTEPVAGFWGMRFPAAGSPAHATTPASAAPKISAGASSVDSKPSVPFTSDVTSPETKSAGSSLQVPAVTAPAPPLSSAVHPPASSQSSSHPIHTYSSGTPAVSGGSKPSNVLDISKSKAAKTEAGIATNLSGSSRSILDSDQLKIPSWLEPLARNAAASSAPPPELQVPDHEAALEGKDLALTEISETPEAAAHPVAAPTFGRHLLTEENVLSGTATTGGSSKKILIGAIAAAVLLVAGGAAWYVRQLNAGSAPVSSPSSVNPSADSARSAQTPSQSQVPTSPGTYTAVSSPTTTGAGISTGSNTANGADAANVVSNANKKLATVDTPVAAAAVQPKRPSLGSVNLSAPVVNRPAVAQDHVEEALNLGSSNVLGGGEGLSSGLVASSKQPVAPPAPLPVGGAVKAARLISSVAPQYPSIARSQRIAGDVKIDALVDVTGQVAGMKIISGPVLLQQPAMDALRRWKYEPAQLNGKAVPMHLTVTIQFKLQ
ncbi:MAG: TonB family protein [Acidobacteriota bacterium]|nr:TonB family protein [Acidobacteriota bacterium]